MDFNKEQFVRDILGATGGKVTIEKGTLNKSFDEMKEDLEKVFKPKEPLFSLTAEEVETVSENLDFLLTLHDLGRTRINDRDYTNIENLLTRIKQWQDEQIS